MINRKGQPYREFRCNKCRALLALEYIYAGRLSIKCPVCNTINDIDCRSTKKLLLEEGSVKPISLLSEERQKGGETN